MKRTHLAITLTIVLGILVFAGASVSADWAAFQFRPGQLMSYSIWIEHPDRLLEGDMEFFVQEAIGGEIALMVSGFIEDEYFEGVAGAEANDLEGLYEGIFLELMMQLSPEMMHAVFATILVPWFDSILPGETLYEGYHIPYDDEWGFSADVVGHMTQADRRGWLLEVDFHEDDGWRSQMELGIDPDLPLPIFIAASNVFDGPLQEADVVVRLDFYDANASPRGDLEVDRDFANLSSDVEPTGVLADLLDHFEAHGLEIGELSPKAYRMLGAAQGFGVEVDEEVFEVYWFDPEAISAATQANLDQASETGIMHFPEMEWKLPGLVRNHVFITALEFGTFWVHPRKDDIAEALETFQP